MQAHEAATLFEISDVSVLTAEDFTAEALRPALHRIIGGHRRRPLTKPEHDAARATVNPTIVIDSRTPQMFTTAASSGRELISVLDREQERLARNLGPGYRMIRGVAGSGKTLVITHRAVHISRLLPHWRILVLCFNVPLRSTLREELSACGNVTVKNLDALAFEIVKNAGRSETQSAGYGEDAVALGGTERQ